MICLSGRGLFARRGFAAFCSAWPWARRDYESTIYVQRILLSPCLPCRFGAGCCQCKSRSWSALLPLFLPRVCCLLVPESSNNLPTNLLPVATPLQAVMPVATKTHPPVAVTLLLPQAATIPPLRRLLPRLQIRSLSPIRSAPHCQSPPVWRCPPASQLSPVCPSPGNNEQCRRFSGDNPRVSFVEKTRLDPRRVTKSLAS